MTTVALPSYRVRFVHLTALWAYRCDATRPRSDRRQHRPTPVPRRDSGLRGAPRSFPGRCTPGAHNGVRVARREVLAVDRRPRLSVRVRCVLVPIAARAVKLLDPTLALAIGLLAVLVVAGLVAYTRLRPVRLFVGYSLVLPVLSFGLVRPRLARLSPSVPEPPPFPLRRRRPVVFVVLDELAASSLMTRDGELDTVSGIRTSVASQMRERGIEMPRRCTTRRPTRSPPCSAG